MTQYIDKSAIVAEIERRIKEGEAVVENVPSSAILGLIQAYKNVLSFLDALEVKEIGVDVGDPRGDIGVKTMRNGSNSLKISRHGDSHIGETLEEAAKNHKSAIHIVSPQWTSEVEKAFKAGAQWQKENLWKDAQGEDLPEIDREVIALLSNGKVVYAHRPQEYWDGKNIATGEVTRHYPVRHDKGGWNQPNVKWWLDLELPKMEE